MNERRLASRYARALLRAFSDKFSLETMDLLKKFLIFLHEHKNSFFYLKLSLIPQPIKVEMLSRAAQRGGVQEIVRPILLLLAQHRRLYLIDLIIAMVIEEYYKQENIEEYSVMSVSLLTDDEEQIIQKSLTALTHKKVITQKGIDTNLIAGVRIQSKYHLWEQSIRQFLNEVARRKY